jgi:hypothetical protein
MYRKAMTDRKIAATGIILVVVIGLGIVGVLLPLRLLERKYCL